MRAGRDGFQHRGLEHFDFAVADAQPAFLLELRQQAADAFDGQAQVVADFLARHAQLESVPNSRALRSATTG
jgi:hypothetical protein